MAANKYGDKVKLFTSKMRKKLRVLFIIILVAFVALGIRLYVITRDNGDEYARQVLSQQKYDSVVIPFKRGNIYDSNGMVLATSNKVYNVILDCSLLLTDEANVEPTITALRNIFGIDSSEVRTFITENPGSKYKILAKKLPYEKINEFTELQKDPELGKNIRGIWFEDEYERQYPNGSLACDVIGFTTADNIGSFGLEQYYNDVLSGTNGREYGYLNEDSALERTVIPASDGYSIISTIDSNVQSIVEKYLLAFNEEYKDKVHVGNGAENVGCIIMEVDTGNILAMASYPTYDLNDPRNIQNLMGMRQVDKVGVKTTGKPIEITTKKETEQESEDDESEENEDSKEQGATDDSDSHLLTESLYVTEESLALMDDETLYQNYNALWKNFCINTTYEPGSVAKPFTVAAALDCGAITGNESYYCNGFLEVGDYKIKCHNIYGDGYLTVAESIERSCNVGLMNIAFATGKNRFLNYQHAFGFGLKTNIDLAGESRTASLVYNDKSMGQTELATNSFGQGFNVTMIQMISGFCSLVNGGNFYEPHMVSKIVTSDGSTIKNIEPRILKQTVSNSTSKKIIEYCNQVVTGEYGTGKTARPAGYMIGGKTGTAETLPRRNGEYVVSFMGYAPANDPQIAIYVVVDRPNTYGQDDAKYATRIVRNVLTEVLPYLHIYMTEELTEKERKELEEKNLTDTTSYNINVAQNTEAENTETENTNTETKPDTGEANVSPDASQTEQPQEVLPDKGEPWKEFAIDPETGYAIDPNTGAYVDPVTGATIGGTLDIPDAGVITSDNDMGAIGDAP